MDGIQLDFGPVAGSLNMMMTLQAPDQMYNSVLIHGRCRAILLLSCNLLLLISVCSFHIHLIFPFSLICQRPV